ncbi:MAG: hypothetical protein HMLKMBBP_02110 [Planctomycetes bacterium]|nr:hypothetical protein [Planctomycetota bacterium]
MISIKFQDLRALELTVQDPPPTSALRPVLLPVYMEEIDSAVAVLNEVHRAHRQDVERNIHPVMPTANRATWKRGWEAKVDQIKPRELYRVVAYLMYATTLAGVVRAAYDDLMKKFAAANDAEASRIVAAHATRIEAARTAYAPVFKVRNKVFAHTALAKPDRPDDTASMKYSSLQYLIGNPCGFGPEGLCFGGDWTFDGDPSPSLRTIGVYSLHIETRHLLAAWRQLLDEAVMSLAALPDADVLRARDGAVSVRRLRPASPT